MNKLLRKIAGVALGLTMAIGVGVAVASNKEAARVDAATSTGDASVNLGSGSGSWNCGSSWSSSGSSPKTDTKTDTLGNTWTLSYAYSSYSKTANASYIQFGSSSKPAKSITLSTTMSGSFNVTNLYSKWGGFSGTAGTVTMKVGSTTVQTGSLSGTSDVEVKQSTGSYSSGVTSNTITIELTGIAKGIKLYSFSYTLSNTTYTVTVNRNNSTYGTISQSSVTNVAANTSISASGAVLTVGSTTVTATPTAKSEQYTYAFSNWSGIPVGGKVTENITVTANFTRTTNTFTVGGTITNGTLSSTAEVEYDSLLNITINPDSGYKLPSTLTSVTMGGSAYAGYTYDNTTGAFSIASVTGNVVIDAECPYDGKTYAINVSVTNGIYSGNSEIGEEGEASITITPNSGYKVPLSKSDITVTNAIEWDYTRTSNSSAIISLLGAEGVVSISAECVALESYSIGFTSEEHFTYSGPSSIQEDGNATLTIVPEEGYYPPSDVTVSGATKSWVQGTGVLTLSNPTGNVSITYAPVERTLTGITISSSSGSFTLGDVFTKPTVTATYNVGGNVDVTNDATATGGGLVDGILTETGEKTITISYGGFSKTYTATVTAIEPSAGGLDKITKLSELTVGSTVYLVCESESKQLSGISTTSTKYGLGADYTTVPSSTVYPLTVETGYSSGTYSFKNGDNYLNWSSSNSLSTNSTLSDNTSWTVAFNSSGNALLANKATPAREIWWNTGSPRFACYTDKTESSSGYAPVQLYKNYPAVDPELKWITAEVKPGTYYQGSSVTASDFTVTAHYDDGNTSTPTTDITVTNGELVNIGANEVTLTYGGKSCKVSVTAIEQTATLTGLAWAQGEYAIIDGQGIDFSELGTITAEYDDGDEYTTKSIAQCSIATYTKNGNNYVKVADLDDGDGITSASHGKYLGVSYTEGLVTEYAYSSAPIYVVEAINDVYGKEETYTWSKTTSIRDGDVVTFVNESEKKVASSYGSNLINSTSYDSSISNPMTFTVGKVGDYYTFHNADGYLGNHSTGTSGSNYAYLDQEIDTTDNKNYFTVNFDNGNVVIKSVYDNARVFQLRSGTPDRFCFYGSTQLSIQLYKGETEWVPTGDSIANTNAVVQKAVLEYAEHFNDTMDCVNGGTTANVSGKWSTLSGDFDDLLDSFSGDNLAHCKALFAGADAVEEGDTLQDMLARYEYICAKYKLSDFLADIDRPPVGQRATISPLSIVGSSGSNVAIIVVISMISITAIGGYFFLRKRKEQ